MINVSNITKEKTTKTFFGFNPFEIVQVKEWRHPAWKYGGFLSEKYMSLTTFETYNLRFPPRGVTPEEYWNWLCDFMTLPREKRILIEDEWMERYTQDRYAFMEQFCKKIREYKSKN